MPAEWSLGRRTYPLIISREIEQALVRYRAERSISQGKALNALIRRGLVAEGFLAPIPTKEEEIQKARDADLDFVRKNWKDMSVRSRSFYLRKYPELEAELGKQAEP